MRPLSIVPLLALLSGCAAEAPRKAGSAAPPAPLRVSAAAAEESEWLTTYEATGTVRASTASPVASKLMGYARDVAAGLGDRVRQGQTLVTLDGREFETAIARAEAARDEVKSAIPEAESGIAAAKARVDLAQVTFQRMRELLDKRSVTKQEFDEASASLRQAEAALEMARAKRTGLDAKMAQAAQEVRAASIQREYAVITAPFAGVVTAKSIEPGALVTPGAPLFVIEREGTLVLEAAVEESRLALTRVGATASVTLDGLDRAVDARVIDVVPSVDSATRTGTVKLGLPSMAGLRSGLSGRARFQAGARKALTVPVAALVERGQLRSVFVAEANAAQSRLITVGARDEGRVEVLSGLSAGEPVIAPVPPGLRDGAAIEVRQ